MKLLGSIFLLTMAFLLIGCGTSSSNDVINGNWTASLTDSSGVPAFGFNTTLHSNGSGGVTVSNLTFTTANPCFASGSTATGGFTLSGTTNGVTTGGFQMTIQSGSSVVSGSNALALQGTLNNNTVSGTWTLTGTSPGCSGSGSFTMNKV